MANDYTDYSGADYTGDASFQELPNYIDQGAMNYISRGGAVPLGGHRARPRNYGGSDMYRMLYGDKSGGGDYDNPSMYTNGYQGLNSFLAPYGMQMPTQISPWENIPNQGFFKNHPRFSGMLNGIISAAANAGPSNTIGEGIGVAGRMIAGAQQANANHINMQIMAPFAVAKAAADLQGEADKHVLSGAESDYYRQHGKYFADQQRNHMGTPFADNEGKGWTLDERNGNANPIMGPDGQIQLSPKFMGSGRSGSDKTLTERQATAAEQQDAEDNGATFSGPGSYWSAGKRQQWIQKYDVNMAGAKGGAGASGRNNANANDPNQLSEVDSNQLKDLDKSYDEKILKKDTVTRRGIRRELRQKSGGNTPSESQIDAEIDARNKSVETQRQQDKQQFLQGRGKKILTGPGGNKPASRPSNVQAPKDTKGLF